MRPHRKVASIAAIALLAASTASVSGAAEHQTVAVMWHAQSGSGLVGDGATASLVRRADGISYRFQTSQLHPGHAYTVWLVVINNPDACTANPCSAGDILLNAATNSQVTYGTGHVVGGSGQASFAGSFQVGALADGWLAGRGLEDPFGADIHLVLNDHGPVISGMTAEMIHTYRAGCTDASLPGIFPASAKADGTPGPNTCRLYQAAVFDGS